MESLITKATVTEWSFGIIGILGAVSACIGMIGKILTTSRCSDCSCFWKCCVIKNDPLEADELKLVGDVLKDPEVPEEPSSTPPEATASPPDPALP